jgi:hypothetical protein
MLKGNEHFTYKYKRVRYIYRNNDQFIRYLYALSILYYNCEVWCFNKSENIKCEQKKIVNVLNYKYKQILYSELGILKDM